MTDKGKVSSFNDDTLLRLGEIVEEDGLTYARIASSAPIDSVMRSTGGLRLATDIFDLWTGKPKSTQRESLIQSRIGQGVFRTSVLRTWDYRCAVTGVSTLAALRASHIKPWRSSSKVERLDPFNGLPLVATIDSLFDSGHVSFSDDGALLLCNELPYSDIDKLGLAGMRLQSGLPKRAKVYLSYHREHVFRGDHNGE